MKNWFKKKSDLPPGQEKTEDVQKNDLVEQADADSQASDKKHKKPWSKKKKTLFACLMVVVTTLVVAGGYALAIVLNPMGSFDSVAQQVTPEKTQDILTPAPDEPTPTIDPYDELVSKADFSMLTDIVNIMLIGVDYAEERDTWGGKKDFHSDVMIVLSINTKTNEINLISLPRDTYAKIPGVKGIYKLNASIDCGGGWPTESGFEKVCEAASWMLGGIPVNYYYAVDMAAVKGLVDSIGGVDFDVAFSFTLQKRSYEAGMQHLDGQGVLDYLRVRKNIKDEGDLHRINRQKEVLVAIFDKIKNSDLIFTLPEILNSFDGNYYTNTTFAQTAGLAAFFYSNVKSSDIAMHSMDGSYHNIFNWRFVLTNQKKRVELIKTIYGVDVDQYGEYSAERAVFRWESMMADVNVERSRDILAKVKGILDADAQLPEKPAPQPDPGNPEVLLPEPEPPAGGYRKYPSSSAAWNLYNSAQSQHNALKSWSSKYKSKENNKQFQATNLQLQADVEALCAMFSLKVPNWRLNYEGNKNFNEVKVDFN